MPRCPNCNEIHPEGTEFCPNDGERLSGVDEAFAVAATAYGPADVHDTSAEPEGDPTGPPATVLAPPRSSRSPETELIGQCIGGVYRVVDLLGVGGMGVVYRVEHINLKKEFALKVLGQVAQDHPDAVERFRQEAVSASHIEHDNIVDIITLDSTPSGGLYIVMELLKGESLADAIRRDAPMAPERALPIFYQICRALHAAHQAGIIHRDLKPENVFLTPKGDAEFVKILDFGISKIRAAENERVRITKTGHVLGTPLYMSPEQAKGESGLDQRVDIYSLGVILFEMLQGSPPFQGDNYFQLIWKHTNEAPPQLEVDVPPGLSEAVTRALAKDPRDRFETMLAFEEAVLEAVPDIPPPPFLLDFRPSIPSQVRPTVALRKRRPRRQLWALAVAAVAALGLVIGVMSLRLGAGSAQSDDGLTGADAAPRHDAALLGVAQPATTPDGGHERRADSRSSDAGQSDGDDAAVVRMFVTSEPPGATVSLDGVEVGRTPIDLERARADREVVIRLVKRGYRPVVRRVTLDRDQELVIPLSRRHSVGGTKVHGGSELPIKTTF